MVRMVCLSARETEVMQEATLLPPTSTVQARHLPSPQPYLVPVNSKSSRRTSSSGRSGSVVTVLGCPFTVKLKVFSIGSFHSALSRAYWKLKIGLNQSTHAQTTDG